MLNSISFETLQFIEPFSTQSTFSNQYKGQQVFLEGATKKPGIIVTRYIDYVGIMRYNFNTVEACLNSGAKSIYNSLLKNKVKKVEFALVPTQKKNHSRMYNLLKRQYSRIRRDRHFEIVKPWLEGERSDNFPFNELTWRRPFIEFEGHRRSSFGDYANRDGWYLIREFLPLENKMINVYVGKSINIISDRIRNKFYPNRHIYYEEIPGEREYHITVIEVQKSILSRNIVYKDFIKRCEDTLIAILDPRDNTKGKIVTSSEEWYEGEPVKNWEEKFPVKAS